MLGWQFPALRRQRPQVRILSGAPKSPYNLNHLRDLQISQSARFVDFGRLQIPYKNWYQLPNILIILPKVANVQEAYGGVSGAN